MHMYYEDVYRSAINIYYLKYEGSMSSSADMYNPPF